MFDNIKNRTKALDVSMKNLPEMFRWSILISVFISLITVSIVFRIVAAMLESDTTSSSDSEEYVFMSFGSVTDMDHSNFKQQPRTLSSELISWAISV